VLDYNGASRTQPFTKNNTAMNLKLKIIVLFGLTFFHLVSCDDRTRPEFYRDVFINSSVKGVVEKTELWKGGTLVITLKGSDNAGEIINRYEISMNIKKGDYFAKKAHSNKCLIQRKDSLLLFDCVELERLKFVFKDSISTIEQWDRANVNKWRRIKDRQSIKELME